MDADTEYSLLLAAYPLYIQNNKTKGHTLSLPAPHPTKYICDLQITEILFSRRQKSCKTLVVTQSLE
jgi:hypothetical protein